MTIVPRPVRVQYVQPTGKTGKFLRRYGGNCGDLKKQQCCNAMFFLGEFSDGDNSCLPYIEDPRWPTHCEECGRAFTTDGLKTFQTPGHDEWQIFTDKIYRAASGQQAMLRQWGEIPGAMWNQFWLNDVPACRHPVDGLSLCIVCPDGAHWAIDGVARNCDMPQDTENHKCWTRNTDLNNLTVNKSFGPTCKAGAGSILTDRWHGFLTGGLLHD